MDRAFLHIGETACAPADDRLAASQWHREAGASSRAQWHAHPVPWHLLLVQTLWKAACLAFRTPRCRTVASVHDSFCTLSQAAYSACTVDTGAGFGSSSVLWWLACPWYPSRCCAAMACASTSCLQRVSSISVWTCCVQ